MQAVSYSNEISNTALRLPAEPKIPAVAMILATAILPLVRNLPAILAKNILLRLGVGFVHDLEPAVSCLLEHGHSRAERLPHGI